jgi:excisionase family DNA binding protein
MVRLMRVWRERAGNDDPTRLTSAAFEPSRPRLWTLHEAAAFLRVSERTIRRQAAARRLHCVRIGRRLLFDPADVSRFVAARKE